MFIAYIVVAVLLALMLVLSGRGKLVRSEAIVTSLTRAGVPESWYTFLATVEFAGALGLIVGIFVAPLGIAAAAGVVLYFLGAMATHLRARDTAGLLSPLPLLIGAALALTFRILTA